MDEWFEHSDVINQIEKYHSESDILVPVYSTIESVLERESCILLPIKSNAIKSCLDDPDFGNESISSDKPFTRDTPRGREFLPRIRNRFSIFPDAEQGLSIYFRKTTQEVLSRKRDDFTEGRHKLELSLRKEIILEDLKINNRKGLFCFDIFRFSEKALDEQDFLNNEVNKGDYYIYRRFCKNIDDSSLRFRMNSVSAILGKILI